ncbi:MAG: type I restriction endonuclease subunit R, partial [Roseovarius sp.]|nr:type I restriction endonuclease subunit R [Roseovarius sp.]
RFCQFGFTGTPIFPENAAGDATTASVFGCELHSYVITDAIRDEKVLKFKVDYNDVRPRFRESERAQDAETLEAAKTKEALRHPERIREVAQYILDNFHRKTHRLHGENSGFNALLAVDGIEAARQYYSTLNELQANRAKPLNIATIFSFAPNEQQDAVGDIPDESLDVTERKMETSAREFLDAAISNYNQHFKTSFSTEGDSFQNYYRDLAKRVKSREVDLLIVVGMFLTGFDAPTLNTLFVDKNLRFHGLIQTYSRTNRIYDASKTFGNIVTFRDLEQATIDAITLFGDANTRNVILEKSYREYMEGYTDVVTGEARRGFVEVLAELEKRFPDPAAIAGETDKRDFAKLFGEYLRLENILRNYDEFTNLQALRNIDVTDKAAIKAFQQKHVLSDDDVIALISIGMPSERKVQDYRSTYNDIRDWLRQQKEGSDKTDSTVDWDDVVFELDLLKSQEINLDYILEQIFENNRKTKNKELIVEDVRRMIRASVGHRAKEGLLVAFIHQADLGALKDAPSVIEAFFAFAKAEQQREIEELIRAENLKPDAAQRYIATSIKREFASEHGTELNNILPGMSPLNPQYLPKKQSVFQKISDFVEKFKGVGGQI